MRIGKLKKEKRYESRTDKAYGIQTFGDRNDYPQQVMEIVGASGTGAACVDTLSKFISGQGFTDPEFYRLEVNGQGVTNDVLLNLVAYDFAMFNGFALHLNYSAGGRITEIHHVPFEQVRLGAPDDDGNCTSAALHWDWGRRMTNLRRWSKDDIERIDLFNPDMQAINVQVRAAGGWAHYKGQVLYYSGNRANNYPLPKYDAVLTDMSTEEGIANISYRNARHNFLMAGMLVDILDASESENQNALTGKNLLQFQGDAEACKLMYVQVASEKQIPQVIDFSSKNYDKEYTVTHKKIKDDIGRAFGLPPILRGEDVGNNFGADAIRNAYDYFNSVTENERLQIERVFARIYGYWHGKQYGDLSIIPLSYKTSTPGVKDIPEAIFGVMTANEKRSLTGMPAIEDADDDKPILAEKIGVGGVQAMIAIISDPNIANDQKRGALKLLFGFSDEDVNTVIPKK